jgi:hypothetical protein
MNISSHYIEAQRCGLRELKRYTKSDYTYTNKNMYYPTLWKLNTHHRRRVSLVAEQCPVCTNMPRSRSAISAPLKEVSNNDNEEWLGTTYLSHFLYSQPGFTTRLYGNSVLAVGTHKTMVGIIHQYRFLRWL